MLFGKIRSLCHGWCDSIRLPTGNHEEVANENIRVVRCTGCQRDQALSGKRLPHSWKRVDANYYCGKCWTQRYVLRAVVTPVASPIGCRWEELRADLKLMWAATTQASNWMITELYVRDIRRSDESKVPPMPHVYLNPEVRTRFPA